MGIVFTGIGEDEGRLRDEAGLGHSWMRHEEGSPRRGLRVRRPGARKRVLQERQVWGRTEVQAPGTL